MEQVKKKHQLIIQEEENTKWLTGEEVRNKDPSLAFKNNLNKNDTLDKWEKNKGMKMIVKFK